MRVVFTCILFIFSSLIFYNYVHALCIKAPDANLRSGPGTKYKKTWWVYKNMPFQKISKKGNWYKVKDVDGDIHWVFENLVTEKTKCAVVKVNKANVRCGPSEKSTAFGRAQKYDSYKVLRRKGRWIKVESNEYRYTGWIFRNLLWIQ